MPNIEADNIRLQLTDRIEEILDLYYPNWVKKGSIGYANPKNNKDLGSFQVNLSGSKRGTWARYSQRIGGGSVELLSYALTGEIKSYKIAFQEAKKILGISESSEFRKPIENKRIKNSNNEISENEKIQKRIDRAISIWSECVPIMDTAAEHYLRLRGITVPLLFTEGSLGFHEGLEWEPGASWANGQKMESGPIFPTLVCRVQDVSGLTTAIWRIFIDPVTGRRIDREPSKMALGVAKGGAVRIGGCAERIGIAEGVETALGAYSISRGNFPVWAGLSTSGLAGVELPLEIERIIVFPDGDRPVRRQENEYVAVPEGGPGIQAAKALKNRMDLIGVECSIQAEPPVGKDYLDLWNRISRLG